jgi:serine/threonine protein kinase
MIGSTLGNRYQICAEIGEGGMATVYRAVDTVLGRDVAIKILHPHLAKDKDLAIRFNNEASIAAKLDQPNILRIFDYGIHEDGRSYMISELVRGQDMYHFQNERLKKTGANVENFVILMICEEVLKGLTAAHAIGVVHRDIKPDNVMISDDGQVKLMDFGIAKSKMTSMTMTGHFLGSPSYSSPEQVQGLEIDGRSDLYSLGVILYESLAGRLPFSGMSASEVMLKIINGKCQHPCEIKKSISPELGAFILKAMSVKANDRFLDAGEMLAELKKFLKSFGIENARAGLEEFFLQQEEFIKKLKTSKEVNLKTVEEVAIKQKTPKAPLKTIYGNLPLELKTQIQDNRKTQSRLFTKTAQKSMVAVSEPAAFYKRKSNFSLFLLLGAAIFIFIVVLIVSQGTQEATFQPTKKTNSEEIPTELRNTTPPPPAPQPTGSIIKKQPEKQNNQVNKSQPTSKPYRVVPSENSLTPKSNNVAQPKNTPQPTMPPSIQPSKPILPEKIIKEPKETANNTKIAPLFPKIAIQTLPTGIPIYLGRTLLGRTNKDGTVSVFNAKPGAYELTIPSIVSDGVKYEGYNRKIFLESGKNWNAGIISLNPMRKLTIAIAGPNVVVKVNGDPYVLSDKPLVLNLPEGPVEIEAKAANGKTLRRNLVLKGENFNLNTSLN